MEGGALPSFTGKETFSLWEDPWATRGKVPDPLPVAPGKELPLPLTPLTTERAQGQGGSLSPGR